MRSLIPSGYYHLAASNFQLVNEYPPLVRTPLELEILRFSLEPNREGLLILTYSTVSECFSTSEPRSSNHAKCSDTMSNCKRKPPAVAGAFKAISSSTDSPGAMSCGRKAPA